MKVRSAWKFHGKGGEAQVDFMKYFVLSSFSTMRSQLSSISETSSNLKLEILPIDCNLIRATFGCSKFQVHCLALGPWTWIFHIFFVRQRSRVNSDGNLSKHLRFELSEKKVFCSLFLYFSKRDLTIVIGRLVSVHFKPAHYGASNMWRRADNSQKTDESISLISAETHRNGRHFYHI